MMRTGAMAPLPATECGHYAIDQWNDLINRVYADFPIILPNLLKALILFKSGGDAMLVNAVQMRYGLMQINAHGRSCDELLDPETNLVLACQLYLVPCVHAFPYNLDAVIAAYDSSINSVGALLAAKKLPSSDTLWFVPLVRNMFLALQGRSPMWT